MRTSHTFAKFIFWFENIAYLSALLLYELILVPIIYLRLIVNIFRAESLFRALLLIVGWIFFGPFYLLHGVLFDVFNFLKILYDYKEEGDEELIKAQEDEMQDKIVIYNEVIDTLRAIMNIFRFKMHKKIKKKKNANKPVSPRGKQVYKDFGIIKQENEMDEKKNPLTLTCNKFDLLEELQR